MQCPSCATESPVDQAFCTHCGARLTPPDEPPILEAPLKESSPVVKPEPSPASRPIRFAISVLLAIAAIAWSIICTYRFYHRDWSSEATGYCFGTLLLPFLVAYAIAGVKRRRNELTFALCFFGFTVLGTGYIWTQSHNGLLDLSAADMVKTMAGTMPLPADASENDRKTVAGTKQFFVSLRQINTSYEQKQAALTPELNKMYTASAFTNRQAIQHMQDVVQQKLALDRETSAKIQQLPDMMKKSLENSGFTEIQKEGFITGLGYGMNNSEVMKARRQMIAAEESWGAATTELYNFVLAHSSQIVIANGSIRIGSDGIRTQFNTKFNHAKQQRDAFNASVRNLFAVRQTTMKSANVTPQDMGLSK